MAGPRACKPWVRRAETAWRPEEKAIPSFYFVFLHKSQFWKFRNILKIEDQFWKQNISLLCREICCHTLLSWPGQACLLPAVTMCLVKSGHWLNWQMNECCRHGYEALIYTVWAQTQMKASSCFKAHSWQSQVWRDFWRCCLIPQERVIQALCVHSSHYRRNPKWGFHAKGQTCFQNIMNSIRLTFTSWRGWEERNSVSL